MRERRRQAGRDETNLEMMVFLTKNEKVPSPSFLCQWMNKAKLLNFLSLDSGRIKLSSFLRKNGGP